MATRQAVPDPNGAADEPECGQQQLVFDALRGLLSGDHSPEHIRATINAAADMGELQIDWLVEQHRIINQLQGLP